MPWCDECSQWFSPNALTAEGHCPKCGRALAKPGPADALLDPDAPPPKAPWHFWVLVAAIVIYLGWRLIQGVGWIAGRF
jgi:hypothetical protein